MKKLLLSALAISSLLFTSCGDDTNEVAKETAENTVTGTISVNTTWTADNIYTLSKKVYVASGVTLTIEPGTIIKGSYGTEENASALVIARGAKLMAEGTASKPIIFTSVADNIEVGQTEGTNLDESDKGLWGGLIVLGKATCSFKEDVTETQIEGIPANQVEGLYGGSIDDDNSGVLTYISIRHGGALIGDGNEINGLTLGGVGSGTVVDHIEVVGNVDDGVEFFGGTVDASNLLVWAQGDDALDVDQAYSGTITNSLVILGDESDHGLEIDGPEGTTNGKFTINDLTLIGNDVTEDGEYADYRSNAQGATNNVYAYGFPVGKDVELDNDQVATNYNNGDLTFGTWQIKSSVQEISDIFANKAETVTVADFGATASIVTTATVGADTSVFAWTYASAKAAF